MSAQTQKVDVLGWIDEASKAIDIAYGPQAQLPREAAHVRALVAALINAATEVRAAHRELPSADHGEEIRQAGEARIGKAHYELEAIVSDLTGGAA